jgi:hypothetical protein
MKNSRMILVAAGVGAIALTASLLQADAPKTIEVEGVCHRQIPIGKQRIETDTIDLNRLFSAGLATAQRALAKTAEIFETAPKREVSANVNVTVRDDGSDTPEKEVNMPLRFSIPKLSEADMDAFADYVVGDPSQYDDLIKTRTSLGISEAEFEKNYKACMEDALKDARANAEREAANRGVKLGEMVSAEADADVSAASESSANADLRLTLNAIFRTL